MLYILIARIGKIGANNKTQVAQKPQSNSLYITDPATTLVAMMWKIHISVEIHSQGILSYLVSQL